MAGRCGFFFYPADWRSDPALMMCSEGARLLWLEMLLLMAESDQIGYLRIKGRTPTPKQIAALTRTDPELVEERLNELEEGGVFSRDKRGVIFSRKMVRDEEKARKSRANGKKGGNPSLCKKTENECLDNQPDKTTEARSQKPETRKEKKRASAPPSYSESFEAFWRAYPDRTNNSKPKTAEAWERLTDADRELAHASLKSYAAFLAKPNAPPCAHATTYLNQRRFETFEPERRGPDIPAEVAFFAKWQDRARWREFVGGPCPDEDGCRAPPDVLEAHGYSVRKIA